MTNVNAELLARVARLHEFAGLLYRELGNIKHALEHEGKVPVAAPETSQAEMEAMVTQLEQTTAAKALLDAGALKNVLIKYLSPAVLEGARGFIKPTDTFKQYEECVMSTPVARVVEWPSGFYRDDRLKEVEFFLRLKEGELGSAVCFTGLPSTTGKVVCYWHNDKGEVECAELHKVPGLNAESLERISAAAEAALYAIVNDPQHAF
jgi:hypothetical protein